MKSPRNLRYVLCAGVLCAGLATAACARLCRILLDDGIDTISLNVRADNAAAIRAYEKLGFAHAADYLEVVLSSREMRETPNP